jgi:hypothetical protein
MGNTSGIGCGWNAPSATAREIHSGGVTRADLVATRCNAPLLGRPVCRTCNADPVTLLSDVIDGAASEAPVSTLLRKLKIVASRSGSTRLADWVERELNGYPDDTGLPEYRGPFAVLVLGHFLGPFSAELMNVQIPMLTFPEDLRKGSLFWHHILNPIAEVEALSQQQTITTAWSGDVIMYYNYAVSRGDVRPVVQDGYVLASAKRPIPGTIYIGAVDGVRNRVLDLALVLEREAPEAGQPDAGADVSRKVTQVVNNFSFNGPANVAVDSHHLQQSIELPRQGDVDGLIAYLASQGADEGALDNLREAGAADIADDQAAGEPRRWRRVRAWFGGAATDIGTGTAAGVLGAAAGAFFGS